MYPYMNEDAAFERLKDLQREMENNRLIAGSTLGLGTLFRNWAERAWWVAGLAMRRPPRRSPARPHSGRGETDRIFP
jgi:hypothetical protein